MKAGMVKEIAGLKWTVLDSLENGVFCICESIGDYIFDGECNNYAKNSIRKKLNTDFLSKLEAAVGTENIIPFKRDLLSLDGLDEYGECEDKVSLISVDEYRKYRKFIPNTGYWWWTLTPWSTDENGDSYWLTVVAPSGYLCDRDCDYPAVLRPVCIFSSMVFESEEE